MKSIIRKTITMIIAALCLFSGSKGIGEKYPGHYLLTGEYESPVTFSIHAPEYTQLAQYSKERLDSLNRLLSHVSVAVSSAQDRTETVLYIDQEPIISITDTQAETMNREQIQTDEENADKDEFISFLDEQYFRLNHLMDELYPVFCKAADSFPEFAGRTSATLNFSGFGKSASKVTIQFSSDYVSEHFPDALADLCENQSTQDDLKKLKFAGSQKIVLLFDQNNNVLKVNYDGTVGMSEDEMRRISLVWKCLRSEDHVKDSLTIKTPAVKGYNRDNISYDRELDFSEPENRKLKWDYQLDQKKEKDRTKIRYTGDLTSEGTNSTGKISYNVKGSSILEHSIIITEVLGKEKEAEYTGTLEITNKTGKIVTSSVMSGFSIGESIQPDTQKKEQTGSQIITITGNEDIPEEAIRALIQKMLTLPDEDTEFLRKDIPDEIWKLLTNH